MTGILYFSSTGNSLYIAEKIKEKVGGSVFYIPKYNGTASEFDRVIIVSPIYSFGLPKHVYDILGKLNKTTEIVFVLNYGGMVGGADYLVREFCENLGLNLLGVFVVKMPENYTLDFTVPKFYLNSVLKSSVKRVEKIANKIAAGEFTLPKPKKTHKDTYLTNKENWYKIGECFSANKNCIKCGKCVKICPVGNIKFNEQGNIVFGDKCVACLGCYHRCPVKAIVYKNKNKKYRYVNPNINESDIGKDI